jgi:hypothetical protein
MVPGMTMRTKTNEAAFSQHKWVPPPERHLKLHLSNRPQVLRVTGTLRARRLRLLSRSVCATEKRRPPGPITGIGDENFVGNSRLKHPPGAPISKGVPLAGGCLEAANARRGTRSRPPTLAWTAQFRTVLAMRLEPSSAVRLWISTVNGSQRRFTPACDKVPSRRDPARNRTLRPICDHDPEGARDTAARDDIDLGSETFKGEHRAKLNSAESRFVKGNAGIWRISIDGFCASLLFTLSWPCFWASPWE